MGKGCDPACTGQVSEILNNSSNAGIKKLPEFPVFHHILPYLCRPKEINTSFSDISHKAQQESRSFGNASRE